MEIDGGEFGRAGEEQGLGRSGRGQARMATSQIRILEISARSNIHGHR
jgi:hypothetical protein